MRLAGWRSRFRPQGREVEPTGDHGEGAVRVPRPLGLRAVAVEFDPVAVGIAQVERLGHAVVARPVEGDAGGLDPAQGVGEGGPIGICDVQVQMAQGGRAGSSGIWRDWAKYRFSRYHLDRRSIEGATLRHAGSDGTKLTGRKPI
jgi:hypothetical protein